MNKILIIGGRGMLGQYLSQAFVDYRPTVWDRDEIDITNQNLVQEKILALRPDVIINAAAYNDVDGAERDDELAKKINGYAVGYLAKVAKELGAVLIHYSTDYVFDGEKETGYGEGDQPNPISQYGRSKYLGEQELQENCSRYYLIRLSRLFGQKGSGQNVKSSFVDKMLELAQNRDELAVVDEEISCPTYAADLAEQTKKIVSEKMPFGIYHVVNSGGCTWYDLAKEIFAIRGLSIKINPTTGENFVRPARRPACSILLNTKLPALRTWQQALRDYLRFI